MTRVEVIGWKSGFRSISFIKLLRESGSRALGLAEAAGLVDRIRLGETIEVDFVTNDDAATFVRRAVELGAVTSDPTDISDVLASENQNVSGDSTISYDSSEYLHLDPMTVSEEDIDSLAEDWLDCQRLPINSPERAKLNWISDLEYDLLEKNPEKLWLLILAVHVKDHSSRVQKVLSAGPLEELLGRHGANFINRIEVQARRNPSFAKLLGGVWKCTMSEDVWSRVQAAWNRRGWDGIPE